MVDKPYHGLEEGGGLITPGESSKSSDILYSNVSSSDAEEELILASAWLLRHKAKTHSLGISIRFPRL
ncbi:hypothetical protein AVEN_114659-1 [Araneus ventricosus]|uniref:Uncharacterized protein n=1 Tax=Araneus ventricosus TaxID=182803 RepID=A0A4Y2NNT5_ARAVE|nr:hypothetical protein AVEN_114659-1 [Araneus ventricosus]